jgi:TonB family protein
MSAMNRWIPRFLIASLSLLLLAAPAFALGSEVEQHLRDQYRGKTFILRGFYSGDRLQYDLAGALVGDAIAGDWTSDGFVMVKELRVSHGHLVIEAERRLVVHYDAKEFQFAPEENAEKRKLRIEADLGSASPGNDQADAGMARIFLTEHEELASMVPDYWKPCVRAAGSGGHGNCRFSAEFQSIQGVAASAASTGNVSEGCASAPRAGECPPARDRGNFPRAIYSPSPEFSERARKAKFQGVVTLKLVVDEQGMPTNVHIIRPIGYGLDEQALKCVKQWRFKPAEKDGEPVATEIAVEVDFHLY